MKRLFICIFLVQVCTITLFAQNNIQIYPYKMNPRNHPDEERRHIRSPDLSLFDNKMQFIALRDLSGEDFKKRIDLWVNKDKLGNILWVSYPLIYQDNLKDVVQEIKKRNLYLFDLWGYVPGSGPGGYWRQFVIPDGVLNLFEKELGDRWLGMDNGEQDGRYVGSFAPRMYPLGADRKQQYFNFQRHFQGMGDHLGNKLATLVSLNFGHYFLKEGIYTLIGAETAQGLPNSQIYYSFIRGAGKQYGVNWFGNASVWNRWGWKSYEDDAEGIEEDYNSGGPLKGTSLSLLKRLMYNHLFYNCVAVGFEGSMRLSNDKLSPIGKIQQSAVKWIEKYGDPGVMYTPVAFMTDFFSGWSFPRHLYSRQAYKVWGNLPYERRDYQVDAILDMIYPGYQDASYYRDERGFISPTPFGDIADCLMSDAPMWVINQYPVLVIADELQPGKEINDKLEAYVQNGGHLIITSASLKNMPVGIAGISTKNSLIKSTEPIDYNGKLIQESSSYSLEELSFPSTGKIIQHSGTAAAAVEMNAGNGKITVIASPYGITDDSQCELPVKVEVEKPLAKPYPLLNHVKALLEDIFASIEIFDTNPNLSMITCIRSENEYTVLVSNDGWEQQDFTLQAKTGKITSIKELPTDYAEMKALGFTPKVVTNNIGRNTAGTIAGGNVRMFRVEVKGANVTTMPEIKPTSNKTGQALVLRETLDIKEEILSRPTFFEHFDRVIIDWKYLHKKEKNRLEEEKGWINRQKLKVTVDLTSGINLFPDLRIVNNDPPLYEKSIATMKSVIDKMAVLGADELIIATQRSIENNYTKEEFFQSLKESFQELADYASLNGIQLILRHVVSRTPYNIADLQQLVKEVDRSNFSLAPTISLLLEDKENLSNNLELLSPADVKYLLISGVEEDIHNQVWNFNLPLYQSTQKDFIHKILHKFPDVKYIFDGLYKSYDDEYADSKELNLIL